MSFSRRQFAAGLAATGLSLPALIERVAAQGAASPATRNLPKTYSGRTLKIVWGNSPAFIRRSSCIAVASSLAAATALLDFASSADKCPSGSAFSTASSRSGSAVARSQR